MTDTEKIEHMEIDCPRCGHIFEVNICISYHVCPECELGIG